MNTSETDDRFGWRTGFPERQDEIRVARQRSSSTGNLEDQSRESGGSAPQGHSQIWSGAQSTARSDGQTSGSGSGLKSRLGQTRLTSADVGRFHGGDDGYEGRYERLWRQGERHYLTSRVSGDWDNFPRRNRGTNETGGGNTTPSGIRKSGPEERSDTGQGVDDIDKRNSSLGETNCRNLQGTSDGSDIQSSRLPSHPQPQGMTDVGPSKERQHADEQIGSVPVVQGQPPGKISSDPCLNEDEIDAKRQAHWCNAFARLNGIEPKNGEGSSASVETKKSKRFSPFTFFRRAPSRVSRNLEGDIVIKSIC